LMQSGGVKKHSHHRRLQSVGEFKIIIVIGEKLVRKLGPLVPRRAYVGKLLIVPKFGETKGAKS